MRTKAIILKKQNTGEYDQLVTCYTEEFGKVLAVAKSVKKPGSIQAMHLDVFNLVDFELVQGRGMPIITGAQAENTYPNLKNDLSRLTIAYFFAEVTDRLFFEYQKDESIWDFLRSLLDELEQKEQPPFMIYHKGAHGFLRDKQIEFLNLLGYAPNTSECVFCSRTIGADLAAYNSEAKGVVCKDCFLNGREGIVVKSVSSEGGNRDFLTGPILNGIFESLAEKKLYSLILVKSVIQ